MNQRHKQLEMLQIELFFEFSQRLRAHSSMHIHDHSLQVLQHSNLSAVLHNDFISLKHS